MHYRRFGRTGWQVSQVSLGAWQLGADWGTITEDEALATVRAALDQGINFIDTADVYGDGRSERLVARAVKEHGRERVYIATKAGRRLNPHVAEGYWSVREVFGHSQEERRATHSCSLDRVQDQVKGWA